MRNTYGRSGPQPPAAPAPVPAPKVVVQAELTHDSSARPRRRRDRMPGWLFWPLIALLAAVMCFSGWKLFSVYADYRRGTKDYQSLAEYAPLETFAPQETAPADSYLPKDDYALDDLKDDPARPSVVQRLSLAPMDFDALTAEYPHIVAWIVIPGTNINYPVVYSGDNDYYLYRTAAGTSSSSGSIFMDMDNEAVFADDNTVLYGHNMKNGSMFHDLTLYRSRSFMATHPYIYLYTPEGAYELRIYAVRIAADNDVRSFTLGEKYETYVSRVQDAALFTGTFTPQRGTKLLTLSTCTYDFDHARFLVHAAVTKELKAE